MTAKFQEAANDLSVINHTNQVNPGGYVGFFNPETNERETFSMEGDAVAARRMAIKQQTQGARVYCHQLSGAKTDKAKAASCRGCIGRQHGSPICWCV